MKILNKFFRELCLHQARINSNIARNCCSRSKADVYYDKAQWWERAAKRF